jgi:hypothetical protein
MFTQVPLSCCDLMPPAGLRIGGPGSGAQEVEQGGADLAGGRGPGAGLFDLRVVLSSA